MSLRLNGSTSGYVELDSPATGDSSTVLLPTGGNGTLGRMQLATAQNSTSGTSIDFTGIPSWVKRVTVMFDGVSTNGSSPYLIRVGNSAGIITTGYYSGDWGVTTAVATAVTDISTGFRFGGVGAGSVQQGMLVLNLVSTNSWLAQGSFYDNNPTVRISYVSGRVTGVSPALDRIRITTLNGTDTFDAGSINILYEG